MVTDEVGAAPGRTARLLAGLTHPRRRVPFVLATTGLGMAALGSGGHPVPSLVLVAWIGLAAVLGVFRFRPLLLAGAPHWLRPPHLTRVACLVLGYIALLQVQFSAIAALWWAATVVLVAGASADGQLGAFTPSRMARGWGRRLTAGGAVLVTMALASAWIGNMFYSYTDTNYRYSGTVSGGTAHSMGRAWIPTAAALVLLLVAGWDARSAHWQRLRLLVLPTGAVILVLGVRAAVGDQQHFNELLASGAAYTLAAGPWVLGLAGAVLVAGGLLLLRERRTTAPTQP